MAKKNNSSVYNAWLLFAIASFLLIGGWLMKSFPVLIFFAYAPLFAISDQAKDKESPWNFLEIILLALVISLLSAAVFDFSNIILILTQAILLGLTFAGYSFAYQSLGSRVGKFTIIFFWLGLEYLFIKIPWREQFFFLADAVQIQPTWWRWNNQTGYLTLSLWILVANLLTYLAVLKSRTINWYLVTVTILVIAVPVAISYFNTENPGVTRSEMLSLYQTNKSDIEVYAKRGELIARTAAWISILIILLALVKNKTKKK